MFHKMVSSSGPGNPNSQTGNVLPLTLAGGAALTSGRTG